MNQLNLVNRLPKILWIVFHVSKMSITREPESVQFPLGAEPSGIWRVAEMIEIHQVFPLEKRVTSNHLQSHLLGLGASALATEKDEA